jgi:hypothetical protein
VGCQIPCGSSLRDSVVAGLILLDGCLHSGGRIGRRIKGRLEYGVC